ncbi:hypothetical protein A2U01_0112752, partial [Trifolium medium]|nr:hypothetical protein [Trifolium medium]
MGTPFEGVPVPGTYRVL